MSNLYMLLKYFSSSNILFTVFNPLSRECALFRISVLTFIDQINLNISAHKQ